VQADPHAVLFAKRPDPRAADAADRAERVVAGIELNVDVANAVLGGPLDRVLQDELASDIDPDPLEKVHGAILSFHRDSTMPRPAGQPPVAFSRDNHPPAPTLAP
jgi:hypothetical protein